MPENLQCSNCFVEIRWTPTTWEDEAFCCDGCAMGGPCVCTYTDAPPRLDVASSLHEVGVKVSSESPEEPLIECENCFESLNRPAYYHEGKPYCCEGCADGGPCVCTYDSNSVETPPLATFTDAPTYDGADSSTASKRRANRLWDTSDEDVEKLPSEAHAFNKANSLWNRQDESAEPAIDASENFGERDAEPQEVVEEKNGEDSFGTHVEIVQAQRFQVSVSPLAEVRDVRRFTARLEATPSVSNVMLTHYAGDRATFEVQAASVMSLIKDVMDMESLAIRSLRMMSEGLDIVLETRDEVDSRVQVSAKELVAATMAVQAPEETKNELLTPSVTAPQDARFGARIGDEGELHSFKYEMGVDVFFNGRHQVEIGDVKGPAHMHSWRVQAILEGESSSESGQVVGSGDVREVISSLVTPWNDTMLNRAPPFDEIMPTANNIARYIHDHVSSELRGKSARLKAIRLWESPTSYVEYAGEGYSAV